MGEAQGRAYGEVLRQFESKNVVLLHGVTSSGKTEIYIRLIQKTIDEGRQVLYLLPEIALTVQILELGHSGVEPELHALTALLVDTLEDF